MSTELPPDWAFSRVQILTEGYWDAQTAKSHKMSTAFARYIADHEDAPLDPLLIEAREIAAEDYASQGAGTIAKAIRDGDMDGCAEVRSVLTALRRGIELGKST